MEKTWEQALTIEEELKEGEVLPPFVQMLKDNITYQEFLGRGYRSEMYPLSTYIFMIHEPCICSVKRVYKLDNIECYEVRCLDGTMLYEKKILWFKNLQLHRDNDLPSYFCYSNENLRPPNSEPIWFLTDVRWHKNGIHYRDVDAPVGCSFFKYKEDERSVFFEYKKEETWRKNKKYYFDFNPDVFMSLQKIIKFLYFLKKNKLAFHPENLTGKMIKCELYKLFL